MEKIKYRPSINLTFLALAESLLIYLATVYFIRYSITSDARVILLTLSPFFLIVVFNIIYDLQVLSAYKDDFWRLKLRNSASVSNHESKIDVFIENVIFSRTENFKNDHRANAILVKSAYTVSLIVLLTSLFGFMIYKIIYPFITINISFALREVVAFYLAIAGFINGLSWLEKNKYKEKWNYLAAIYNKIIEVQDYKKGGSDKKIELMTNCLAIDAITTMMWSHRSFKEIVLVETKKGLDHLVGLKKEDHLDWLLDFHFSEAEVLFILENYQHHLLGDNSISNFPVSDKGQWLSKAKLKQLENLKKDI